jgi:Lrp/AsnC family transcriptional regulator
LDFPWRFARHCAILACFALFNALGKTMDRIDRKILIALQRDATLSIADLSNEVGLSQTPCWKRIQKLEAQGIITGRVALLAPEKIGLGLTVLVEITTEDHSKAWLEAFSKRVSEMPEVLEIFRMAGDIDYILKVVVADMAAYDGFYKRLIDMIPIKNVTSRFAMERIKSVTNFDIPII